MTIEREIESLPPLPETIIKINEFKIRKDKEMKELVSLLENDPLVVSSILKITNSSMFSFRNPIEKFDRAVSMLGMNMTISITISSHITESFNIDVSPYGVNKDLLIDKIFETSTIAKNWSKKDFPKIKDSIILPSLVMEVGKFVIASFLKNNGKELEFSNLLKSKTIAEAEIELVGKTSYEISSEVFDYWNLGDDIINPIKNIFTPENSNSEDNKNISKCLNIISTYTDIKNYKNTFSLDQAIDKCKFFGFSGESFKNIVEI